MQFKLLLEIKLPVVLFPLIHCFDCIFFLLHDSHHALLSITYFEKTVKSSVLSILSFCAIFLCLKARGSSMKRGSFNKKRSVKRKSTKVCVVIISDIKKKMWFVNGRAHCCLPHNHHFVTDHSSITVWWCLNFWYSLMH